MRRAWQPSPAAGGWIVHVALADQALDAFDTPTHDERLVTMQVAGIREVGARVEMIDVSEPRPLAADEVLVQVVTAGVGNWDEFVRTGGWDVGGRLPMALGVEAAGTVLAVGDAVSDWSPGDEVMTHPLPLRDQGTWAPLLIAPAALLAGKPADVPWETAAAFPVPALTAEQVIGEALDLRAGEQLLVHGAGGVTGGLLVAVGVLRGAQVIATAGQASYRRVRALGAQHVIDNYDRDWPEQVRAITGGRGVVAAVNAVPGHAADAIRTVADDGRLATITSDPPAEERGITVSNVYVRPDGDQLRALAQHLADGTLPVPVAATYHLADAAAALAQTMSGHAGGAIVIKL
jgi:NADPH:quinone reductase-like Zn-dependent oxidoreductase